MNRIDHPELGPISDIDTKMMEWTTAPVRIGAFGYTTAIHVVTDQSPPSAKQIAAMVQILNATSEFKATTGQYMFDAYKTDIRQTYAKTIGDTRFRRAIKESDLPEIHKPERIWEVITGMHMVWIDENGDLSLSFNTTFDPGHEFVVRFKQGQLYEIMMDG